MGKVNDFRCQGMGPCLKGSVVGRVSALAPAGTRGKPTQLCWDVGDSAGMKVKPATSDGLLETKSAFLVRGRAYSVLANGNQRGAILLFYFVF